jgi:hypothetical protein
MGGDISQPVIPQQPVQQPANLIDIMDAPIPQLPIIQPVIQ